MPLATFHAQQILFAGLGDALWQERAQEVLGDDAALLRHEGPVSSGSNAWAVGGARTASGFPLLGGDPHRTLEAPGVYLQVRLAVESPDGRDDLDVVGFAFAGVPGVQHFAHAGEVAWAITNAMADYQDVVPLARAGEVRQRWTEPIPVRGRPDEPVEVTVTEHGPVYTDGYAFCGPSTVLGDLGFAALLPLLRARSADEVDRALDLWVEPVNNAVIADREGRVRYRLAGRVPVRTDGAWTGWLGPHRAEVDANGEVVTANERRGPESDAVGSGFAPPFRADRIRQLLAGRDDLRPADFAAIHGDTLLATVDLLRTLAAGRARRLGRTDGRRLHHRGPVGGVAARPVPADRCRTRLRSPARARGGRRSGARPVARRDVADRARAAGAGGGRDAVRHRPRCPSRGRRWTTSASTRGRPGATSHVLSTTHAFDLLPAEDAAGLDRPDHPRPGLRGDAECVRCTGGSPGLTADAYRGSVARYVWDLADRQHGGWVVPLGASGAPGPHHHDQLDAWAAAELLPLVTDWDRLRETSLPGAQRWREPDRGNGPGNRRRWSLVETGQVIVIVVVAVLVLAAAAALAVVARRRRARLAEEHRLEAGRLREQASSVVPDVTAAKIGADEAEARAQQARAEADRAEELAAEERRRVAAEEARREELVREADRIDPDVDHRARDYTPQVDGTPPAEPQPVEPQSVEPQSVEPAPAEPTLVEPASAAPPPAEPPPPAAPPPAEPPPVTPGGAHRS